MIGAERGDRREKGKGEQALASKRIYQISTLVVVVCQTNNGPAIRILISS